MAYRWIDVSIPLENGMVCWPGDPIFKIKRANKISKKSDANVSQVTMSVHAGTHMDAPFHYFKLGKTLDTLPLSDVIGAARVIEIKDKVSIKREELMQHNISRGEKILFKTVNSVNCWQNKKFHKNFVYISLDAAKYLTLKKIKLVGVDYLSVGGFYADGTAIHQTLLKAGIWIIEGLNLSAVKSGQYELICLPLKLMNTDGAPARAILRKL